MNTLIIIIASKIKYEVEYEFIARLAQSVHETQVVGGSLRWAPGQFWPTYRTLPL